MTTHTDIISGTSVSHHRGTIDDIDAASAVTVRDAVQALLAQPDVREAFALQTCNRAEFYVVTGDRESGRAALDAWLAGVDSAVVRELDHEESLRHLLCVASGLESLVLGEDQIIGQFRDAYETARAADGVGPVLEDALTKALHVGERARTETDINEGVVSLGSAAVRVAETETDLDGASALVVGAGEMGSLAATVLADRVDDLVVANRTVANAEHVAETVSDGTDVEAKAVGLADLAPVVAGADVVISATGSDAPVLDRETLAAAGETFVVDIAKPRDVAPGAAALEAVTVRDLDALEAVTDETRERRRAAAEEVEAIVDEEFENLLDQYKRKRADRVIAAMYEGAERIKAREVRTALSKLEREGDLTDEQRATVESLADTLVGQLLAPPTRSLRDAAQEDDWSTINTALRLFGPALEFDEETVEPPALGLPDEMTPEDLPEEMRNRMPSTVLEQLGGQDD